MDHLWKTATWPKTAKNKCATMLMHGPLRTSGERKLPVKCRAATACWSWVCMVRLDAFSGVAGRFGVATHRVPPVRVPAEDQIWQRELRLRAAVLLEAGFREKSAELSSDSSAFSVCGEVGSCSNRHRPALKLGTQYLIRADYKEAQPHWRELSFVSPISGGGAGRCRLQSKKGRRSG